MRGIGEVAKASGLAVSALRFYDGAGVLVPASVDPVTGYRWYSDAQVRAARLIAGLRRVGLPVAEIAAAVREMDEPDAVRRRLHRHRRRLEDGLADAQRELLRIHALLDLEEKLMTRITLPAAALAASLDAVRFAAAAEPDGLLPAVLFDAGDSLLTLAATDRYRLAVAELPAAIEGPPVRLSLPLAFVDGVRALPGEITLDLTGEGVRAESGGAVVEGKPLAVDFPDYRRLTRRTTEPVARVTVDTQRLREMVQAAPVAKREHDGSAYDLVIFGLDPEGSVRVATESEWSAERHVAVNREFLLQALDAGGAGQLLLELDGPIQPLAVRVPGGSRFSILMPVRND
ncbi:MerR family transcriptional regulator [Actinoplanes sp. CA-030573]|uniref:MerR family transcriptional regulator n=1 Tax=Actinoplanes sp. CA-030573 TaxID=3239898 RepID=UPI003D8FF67F